MSEPRRYTLRQARELAGLGREAVAARAGISSKTLERWEAANRARRPDVEQLAVIYELEVERIRFTPAPARAVALS